MPQGTVPPSHLSLPAPGSRVRVTAPGHGTPSGGAGGIQSPLTALPARGIAPGVQQLRCGILRREEQEHGKTGTELDRAEQSWTEPGQSGTKLPLGVS